MPKGCSGSTCARGRFLGLTVRRQVPVGPWIVDFLIAGLQLVIEIDGGQHVEARLRPGTRLPG